MTLSFSIAICTYKRGHLINERTLTFLRSHSVSPSNIFIFIGGKTEEDFTGYDHLATEYSNLIRVPHGLHNARNAVRMFFPKDSRILFLDDDIKQIAHISKGHYDFVKECEQAFELCKEYDVVGFGFYPTLNYGWMKPTITIGSHLLYGCAFGCLNTREFANELQLKEDYEFSAWAITAKGAVLRINYLAPVQQLRQTEGGLSDYRSVKTEEHGCDVLLKKYPDLLRKVYRQHWPELKMKRAVSTIVLEN